MAAELKEQDKETLWYEWLNHLIEELSNLSFVKDVRLLYDPPHYAEADVGISILLKEDAKVVESIAKLSEIITESSCREYKRKGKLPLLYWETRI